MNNIIIKNNSDLTDVDCLRYVIEVVKQGRISNDNQQYCFITKFLSGAVVSSYTTKTKTDVFIVTKE